MKVKEVDRTANIAWSPQPQVWKYDLLKLEFNSPFCEKCPMLMIKELPWWNPTFDRCQFTWQRGQQRSSLMPLSAPTPILRFMLWISASPVMTCPWWRACPWTKDTTSWSGEAVREKEQCLVGWLLAERTEEWYPCESSRAKFALKKNFLPPMPLSGMMQQNWWKEQKMLLY